MSYILDALKKSEQERNQENIPVLHTASHVVFSHRYLWIGILIGVGVLSLIAALAWFVNLKLFQPIAQPAESARLNPGVTTPVTKSETADVPSRETGEDLNGSKPKMTTVAPAPTPASTNGELSAAARARLEGLSVNVVSYSEVPARRFIMLNQRIVRESETLGEGIIVKQILPDGAVLSVDGQEIVVRPQ